MIQSTPKVPPVVSDKLAVVYESGTGKIVHMHRVTNLKGGRGRSDDKICSAALEQATKIHPDLHHEHVKVALVNPETHKPGASYKIDRKTLQLVGTPRVDR